MAPDEEHSKRPWRSQFPSQEVSVVRGAIASLKPPMQCAAPEGVVQFGSPTPTRDMADIEVISHDTELGLLLESSLSEGFVGHLHKAIDADIDVLKQRLNTLEQGRRTINTAVWNMEGELEKSARHEWLLHNPRLCSKSGYNLNQHEELERVRRLLRQRIDNVAAPLEARFEVGNIHHQRSSCPQRLKTPENFGLYHCMMSIG